ncbi:glycosyltransferase family 18 protein [Athelia psychrophila]|uniref:alpha-1,6-mannosyl-glycoprotein 6-beta-N-acetylglucosaminyltransferase n=1 Tax=Athelia psychrophila TaxID=1759441 RepID=A0A167VPK1_9AGAM|nr:glycosyltransferase family 18 protein [Fibularhizoctonia sp. CBS 109695]
MSSRGRLTIASLLVVCVVAGAWLSLNGMAIYPEERSASETEANAEHLCPTISPCPPQPTCPGYFVPARVSDTVFPEKGVSQNPWISDNTRKLRALYRCLEDRSCGENQAKVVILGSYHFQGARMGWKGGEDIWAQSVMSALEKLGYTYIHSLNMERTIQLYQTIPHLVAAILVEPEYTFSCFEDKENCLLSDINPDGIPAWKLFSFFFWAMKNNPLGASWTLVPEDYSKLHSDWDKSTYIGYSIEAACHARSFVPHNERKKQAYVMTKHLRFFSSGPDSAWSADLWEAATEATGIQFVVGTGDHNNGDADGATLPAGLTDYGQLDQPAFLEHVSHSQVLIGVGQPATSPTPYEALCLGIPFINPIMQWDHDHPSDKSKWTAQHWMLSVAGPPYVYNVFANDREGFISAIRDAASTPIDSYVPEWMRTTAVEERVNNFMRRDWKSEAAALLDRRKNGEEGPLFVV